MDLKLCANNDGEPVYSKELCKSCYFRQHDAGRNYKKSACRDGHPYTDGSFKLSSSGKRICLECLDAKKKTHCPKGHLYDDENTFYVNGSPQCKTCRNQRMRDRRPASGIGAGGSNKAKTHCPQGHEYTEENTYTNPQGRRQCKECSRANGQRQRIKQHGVSLEDFAALLESQNGYCAICKKALTDRSGQCIDHDHACCPGTTSCGKCVRGILCTPCNTAIGFMKDSPELLRAAADYLARTS